MKKFVDWRVIYYNERQGTVDNCKCIHVNKKDVDNSKLMVDFDVAQQDTVEFVFDLINEADKEYVSAFYIVPVDLLNYFGRDNDADMTSDLLFSELVDNYIKFEDRIARNTFSVTQKQKNERIMANERLRFFFKCHCYYFDLSALFKQANTDAAYNWRGNGNCRTFKQDVLPGVNKDQLQNVPSAKFTSTFIKPTGSADCFLLSIRISCLNVYRDSVTSQRALAKASNQPFDDLEPLTKDKMFDDNNEQNDELLDLAEKVESLRHTDPTIVMHNLSNVEINNDDVETLEYNFFMTDNVLHKMLYEVMNKCEVDAAMYANNTKVFVCNTMLMAQLTTYPTPYDNNITCIDDVKKQMEWMFTNIVETYCTHLDIDKKRLSSLVDKDFLFFPINSDNHWALYFCYKPFSKNEKSPIIYIVDSLFDPNAKVNSISTDKHSINVLKLRCYLECVDKRYGRGNNVNESRKSTLLRTPQQQYRSNACGFYVFLFISQFVEMTKERKKEIVDEMIESVKNNRNNVVIMADNFKFITPRTFPDIKKNIIERFKEHYTLASARKKQRLINEDSV